MRDASAQRIEVLRSMDWNDGFSLGPSPLSDGGFEDHPRYTMTGPASGTATAYGCNRMWMR